ncbi:MAG: hypothetical protein LC737_08655, partial [Chloroflexi bacterium]|nr:hypothetical protein [Chloroflexota bacterium]
MSNADNDKLVQALQKMWRKEIEAAQAYRQVARLEKDERRRVILNKLADVEEGHAAAWAKKIEALGGHAPRQRPPLPTSMRYAPPEVILEKMEQAEGKIEDEYHRIASDLADDETRTIISHMREEEDVLAERLTRTSAPTHATRSALDNILGREKWHMRGGSWIGDAIYGVNDGLGAVFG